MANSRVLVKNAGGHHTRFVLVVRYKPRKGNKTQLIHSNHWKYGKAWASPRDIKVSDKLAFLDWIDKSLAAGGGSKARDSREQVVASRRSARLDGTMSVVRVQEDDIMVEEAVLLCLKALVDQVVRFARCSNVHDSLQRSVNIVGSKVRRKTDMTGVIMRTCPFSVLMTRRMRAVSSRLTQRKRGSKGYAYRNGVLKRAAAFRVEQDLEWLQFHQNRLATIIARQDLRELLPEGKSFKYHLNLPF